MRWRLRTPVFPIEKYQFSPIISLLLSSRGIAPDMAERYLFPRLGSLYSPFLFKDMERVVDRLILALNRGEKVLIHGDFDVDGVTSLALMYRALKRLGFRVFAYVPNRFDEGYGVSIHGVEKASKIGATVMITVDCGITANEEVKYAKSLKIDVIITDHHEPKDVLPPAYAIINPKLGDYPYDNLAGVGVAFKLLEGLYDRLKKDKTELFWDLDLVALGTISDLVPLIDENRIFAKAGISIINKTKKAGLKALKNVSGIKGNIDTYHISFILAPRLNAAGRMEDAIKAFQLLVTSEGVTARQYAVELNNLNLKRQRIEKEIVKQALDMSLSKRDKLVYVLYSENWHEGVVGIVASRIVEKFYRPAILLTRKDNILKGSARSIPGFNIFEAIAAQGKYLETFGGHKYAAGLSLKPENLEKFEEGINIFAKSVIGPETLEREIEIDADISDIYYREELIDSFELFQPFGMGNTKPKFLFKGARIVGDVRRLKENFYKFRLDLKGDVHTAIYSGKEEVINSISSSRTSDVVFTLREDRFFSKKVIEVIDARPST